MTTNSDLIKTTPRQREMLTEIAERPRGYGNRATRPTANALVAKGLARWTSDGLTITDSGLSALSAAR